MADFNTTVNRARVSGVPAGGFPWRLLIISIVVFGLTVLIYFGIAYGYTPYLNSQVSKVKADLNTLSKKIDDSQQKILTDFYSQIYNIQTLQSGHIYPSKFFDFIESNTYPSIKLTGASVGVQGGEVKIEGVATDFSVLTNYLAIIKNQPTVGLVSLEGARQRDVKDGGGIPFSITIAFNQKFFSAK